MAKTVGAFIDQSRYTHLRTYAGFVFDLDNTLLDTGAMDPRILDPVIKAVQDCGERSQAWLRRLRRELMWRALNDPWIKERLGLTEVERQAAGHAFAALSVTSESAPPLFEDAVAMIDDFAKIRDGALGENLEGLAIVTRGFRRLQRSKVTAHESLTGLFGDDIYVDDAEEGTSRPGQIGYLRQIISSWACAPHRILVIGDNASAELAAALRLGMDTAEVIRPGAPRSYRRHAGAHRRIDDLRVVSRRLRPE